MGLSHSVRIRDRRRDKAEGSGDEGGPSSGAGI